MRLYTLFQPLFVSIPPLAILKKLAEFAHWLILSKIGREMPELTETKKIGGGRVSKGCGVWGRGKP
ncbi:hypothetical protein ASF13_10315 [Erwinia sp. Leaf53]|nr:hypothetical protein ASF13_10315 [Erwinia sp. Leaf53]